jgi:hypothetical protein
MPVALIDDDIIADATFTATVSAQYWRDPGGG